MSKRNIAAIATASLALGILVGAAGALAVRDVASPAVRNIAAHMAAMNGTHELVAGQLGTEMASRMTEMMGSGMMDWSHMELGPMDPSSGTELHRQHHRDWP